MRIRIQIADASSAPLMAGFLLMRRMIGNKALSDANGALSGEIETMFQRLIESSAGGELPRGAR